MSRSKTTKDPASLSIEQFYYGLPDERIARYPLEQRDKSKLLSYCDGRISDHRFDDIHSLLNEKDCLVFNDTKVVHARLHFQRSTGARIEVFCLEPVSPAEVSTAFATKGKCEWLAMVGNSKKWKDGEILVKAISTSQANYELNVELVLRKRGASVVRFTWDVDKSFAEVLDEAGILPIPPYLKRESEASDEERYQTIYADHQGSVAAPTAGLHFTQEVFDTLNAKNIGSLFVTLHVGAGTFMPVKSATMGEHDMHRERIVIEKQVIEYMLETTDQGRIVSVGTTSMRTIESVFWFGVKLIHENDTQEFSINQWDPYELDSVDITVNSALEAVLNFMHERELNQLSGSTQLLIAPGYDVKLVDALVTNFHQPNSTLLLLVAALIGDDWKKVYDHALASEYRFLSFGDSSILFRS